MMVNLIVISSLYLFLMKASIFIISIFADWFFCMKYEWFAKIKFQLAITTGPWNICVSSKYFSIDSFNYNNNGFTIAAGMEQIDSIESWRMSLLNLIQILHSATTRNDLPHKSLAQVIVMQYLTLNNASKLL